MTDWTEDRKKAWEERVNEAQWHIDGMAERGIAEYPGVDRDRAILAADARLKELEAEAKRWKEYAEHQEHCATCGEAVSDCTEGSELCRRAKEEGDAKLR